MKCFMCKGEMVDTTTTYFADLGKSIVIIKGVPCQKCSQCGEVAYSGKVAKQIERIVDILENSMTEIAVVNYSDRVA